MSERPAPTRPGWTTSSVDGQPVFSVSGEIDIATADRLRAHLVQWVDEHADDGPLVLDLSAVTFLDSSGVRALVAAHRADRRQALVLRDPSAPVRAVLDIALGGLLPVETTA